MAPTNNASIQGVLNNEDIKGHISPGDCSRSATSGLFKKACPEFSKGLSSPALRLLEGKAAALFARGAYWYYVSTEQWRERRWWLFSDGIKQRME